MLLKREIIVAVKETFTACAIAEREPGHNTCKVWNWYESEVCNSTPSFLPPPCKVQFVSPKFSLRAITVDHGETVGLRAGCLYHSDIVAGPHRGRW